MKFASKFSIEDDCVLLVKPGLFGSKKRQYTFDQIVDCEMIKAGPGFGYGSGNFEKYAPDGFDNHFKVIFRDGTVIVTRFFSAKMTGWSANEMMTQMEKLCDIADVSHIKGFLYN